MSPAFAQSCVAAGDLARNDTEHEECAKAVKWQTALNEHSESKTETNCITTEMSCFRIHSLSRRLVVCALSVTCIGAASGDESKSGAANECQIGAYRFSDGEVVDISRSEGDTFRWRKFNGTTGVLHKKEDG